MDVLLVDDNRELRDTTRALLEILGHRVIEASSGEEALERATGRSFDLLMTDLRMPGIDGVELTRRLLLHAPDLAVLTVSSESEDPRLRRRLGRGDVAFLAKPFSADDLRIAIEAALSARERRPSVQEPSPRPSPTPSRPPAGRGRRRPSSKAAARSAAQATGSSRRARPRLRTLAAAAMTAMAAAVAILVLEPGPPELPAPPATSTVRGTEIELLDPVGPIAELPADFRWRPVDGVDVYRLTVYAVDDAVVWQGEADEPRLLLPLELVERLQPAVAYTWAVTAFDESGNRLAWSAHTRFRVLPRTDDSR